MSYRNANSLSNTCSCLWCFWDQEIIAHLSGKMDLEETMEASKIIAWGFAKRQMTWFRRFPDVGWLEAEAKSQSKVPAGNGHTEIVKALLEAKY